MSSPGRWSGRGPSAWITWAPVMCGMRTSSTTRSGSSSRMVLHREPRVGDHVHLIEVLEVEDGGERTRHDLHVVDDERPPGHSPPVPLAPTIRGGAPAFQFEGVAGPDGRTARSGRTHAGAPGPAPGTPPAFACPGGSAAVHPSWTPTRRRHWLGSGDTPADPPESTHMADLKTSYLGLSLPSPLVVASSALSNRIENLEAAEGHGAGAVVLRSLFEEQLEAGEHRPGGGGRRLLRVEPGGAHLLPAAADRAARLPRAGRAGQEGAQASRSSPASTAARRAAGPATPRRSPRPAPTPWRSTSTRWRPTRR